MKIKILEYERYKSGKIKVKSHNLRKGKYKPNPNYDFHKNIAFGSGKYDLGTYPILNSKVKTIIVNEK